MKLSEDVMRDVAIGPCPPAWGLELGAWGLQLAAWNRVSPPFRDSGLSASHPRPGAVLYRSRPRRLAALLAMIWLAGALPVAAQFGPSGVALEPVREVLVAPTVVLPGTVEAVRASRVAAAEEGLVLERHVTFGQKVKRGQLLVRLDAARARARAAAAKAEADAAKARYDKLVAGERPEKLAEQKAVVARCAANVEDSRRRRARAAEVFRRGAGTAAEHDEADARFLMCSAELVAAQAALSLLAAGTRAEELAEARAAWERAVAAQREAETALSQMEVVAPFDGQVGKVEVEVGDWVARGGTVAELVDLSEVDVAVLVPESRVNAVQMLALAQVQFASTVGAPRTLEGKVHASSPKTTPRGRTIQMLVRLTNKDGLIRAGMTAEVRLPIGKAETRLVVPKDAVVRNADGSAMVWGVEAAKAVPMPVKLGDETADAVVLLSGAKAGERVVVRGNERLHPGAPVAEHGAGPAKGGPAGAARPAEGAR
ncbi:MAG: efflux RND transporter periplasmic adaptor subunit [Candidatus Riflebacteria bacterium]|nr:efflux RND transporter periplasmic adaptor subunit [Candidatus Riflebacteria bacterium]